ncbi:MarR family transcriptional regulator [Bdellovibrio sp. 22V]|uniref:MarR family winged helix-turn-helix transcriptional regulator n=1 Tax=Bdellovibrio TaxID=958 RepID=UPI0025434622|nr:MarR family transcriptional regulator [Bdellovibrio sp. 22V]WII70946.1 MarR family transcriptional regulator [Bdellovibrio sp. 22V]
MKTKAIKITDGCYTPGVHPALRQYFGYCLMKAAMKHKAMLAQELDKYKIVSPQLGILKLLQILGPVSQIALGQDMHIDKASMVKFIDGLEKQKYVRRTPDKEDRRIKLVELTDKGAQVLEKLVQIRADVEKAFLAPLTQKEQNLFRELVGKLL